MIKPMRKLTTGVKFKARGVNTRFSSEAQNVYTVRSIYRHKHRHLEYQ
jgi:hypothetical protein